MPRVRNPRNKSRKNFEENFDKKICKKNWKKNLKKILRKNFEENFSRGIYACVSKPNGETSGKKQKNVPQSTSKQQLPESTPQASNSQTITPEASTSTLQQEEIQEIPLPTKHTNSTAETRSLPTAFDSWIDELKEFEETRIT